MKRSKILTLLHDKYPKAGDAKTVKVKYWNDLMDDLGEIMPSDATATINTINEKTTGAGVTVEGVKMENGYISHYAYASMIVPYFLEAAPQALSGAGAINTTAYFTAVTTTGPNALTLAAPSMGGQLKEIQMVSDGGVGTITVTGGSGFTTIAMDDVGDNVLLIAIESNGSFVWRLIRNIGCAIS